MKLTDRNAVLFISMNWGNTVHARVLYPHAKLNLADQLRRFLNAIFRTVPRQLRTYKQNGGEHYAALYTVDALGKTEFEDATELAEYLRDNPPVRTWESCDFHYDYPES